MINQIKDSKRLAYMLRHSEFPDHNGWVAVEVVLKELHISLLELENIVSKDSKGRFEFSENRSIIRALYGHSCDVDLGLLPSQPPNTLYHGTAEKYLCTIMRDGLLPRGRKFIHLSETPEIATQVGTRHGSPVVLSINAEAMASDGYKLYRVQSGIWLTGIVEKKYIKKA